MEKIKAILEKHPYLIGVGLFVVVLIYFVMTRSGGSTTASSSGIDPTEAALAEASLQSQTQLTGQQNQISGQLALSAQQGQDADYQANLTATTQQQANQISGTVALTNANDTYQLGLAQVAQQIQESNNSLTATTTGIAAQLAGLESNNQTSENIANIGAEENVAIANITGQTQIGIANDNAQVGIAQANDNLQLGQTYANASVKNNAISTGGGILKGLIGALL